MAGNSGIKWICVAPGSGYGDASVEYLSSLDQLGCVVSWQPTMDASARLVRFDNIRNEIPGHLMSRMTRLWNRRLKDTDTLMVHTPPPGAHRFWLTQEPELRKFCHVSWEVETLPDDWPESLNRFEKVFVPSGFTGDALLRGGIKVPVQTIPHIARKQVPGGPPVNMGSVRESDYIFYSIGAWTGRKDMQRTIRAYLDAFTGGDDVALIIKTGNINQTLTSAQRASLSLRERTTAWAIARLISGYRNPPRVHLVPESLTPGQIDQLHAIGNCYISLTHAEGWGLGAFDAAIAGNPVIMTGWGGQLDFLGRDYPYLVDFEMDSTANTHDDGFFLHDDNVMWAVADHDHAVSLLRESIDIPRAGNDVTRRVSRRVKSDFSAEKIGRQLMTAMDVLNKAGQ